MFGLSQTTPDDRYLTEKLNGTPLSGGMYVEIHISSLVDKVLTTKDNFSEREIQIPSGTTISQVTKVQTIQKKDKSGKEEYAVDRVSFYSNGKTYIVDTLTFSMLLKRCFHTKKSTVCFSLRDEDKPQN